MSIYEKYSLSHAISVEDIVSADQVTGPYVSRTQHVHQDAWEMCCCFRGSMQISKNGSEIRLNGSQVVFVPPGVEHGSSVFQDGTVAFLISFTCSNAEHLRSMQDSIVDVSGNQVNILQNIIKELELCFIRSEGRLHLDHFIPSEHSPFGAEQMISCYLEQFIIMILREATMKQGQVVSNALFKDALQAYLGEQVASYIRENLNQPLTVEQIAEHFHYSRTHLTHICKQATSMSIGEMITQERIQQAKLMLLEQKKTVAQISQELGFSSPAYFSYKFKQVVGCAPSAYAANAAP